MTVLFADVVHSMDIAAAVGAERLRESHQQWRDWVSPDIDYIEVCPGLPLAPD